jgi:iron complex outermembrane receptor protein
VFIPFFNLNIPTIFPDRSITANRFTYRASLDHRFSPEVLVYASYNTGFKSGGYNTGSPGTPAYDPEDLKAAEIGVKLDLLDRKLRLNLAAFHYDYSDIQTQRVALTGLEVFNGAKARVNGIDGDFTAVLSKNFSLTGGFTLLDTKFTNFNVCPISAQGGGEFLVNSGPGTAFPTGCTGNNIPFAAKFAGSVAANYTAPLGGGELLLSGNVYYNSGYSFETDNVLQQSKYAKLGASAKWISESGFSVGAYGRNLTQKRTSLYQGSQSSGNTAVAYADPREYGVTVGFAF